MCRKNLCRWPTAVLFLTSLVHLLCAPATKVEESFNVQATHDLLYHGFDLDAFDHLEFPGVVPRTWLGATAIAIMAAVVKPISELMTQSKVVMLIVSRAILAGLVTLALHFFAERFRLQKANKQESSAVSCPSAVSAAFMILCALQFHLPYYMSRMLPNTFSLGLSALGLGYWAETLDTGSSPGAAAVTKTVVILTSTAVIFRCDAVILVALVGIHLVFVSKQVSLGRGVALGVGAFLTSLTLTILVDSFFWRRWLWPEGEVLYFNTVLNKSKEWGVSPMWWYFTTALPKMLHTSYPLSFVGAAVDRRARAMMFVAVGYTALYSLLAHKEVRFLFPTLPLWNMSAAIGLCSVLQRGGKAGAIARTICVLSMACGIAVTFMSSFASYDNYPGAKGLKNLIAHIESVKPPDPTRTITTDITSVHIDTLAATSGVSRFFENDLDGTVAFSKEEGVGLDAYQTRGFDYLLNEHAAVPGYVLVRPVQAFGGVRVDAGALRTLRQLVMRPTAVLRRDALMKVPEAFHHLVPFAARRDVLFILKRSADPAQP